MSTTFTLPISGMTCASCVCRVEESLARVPGVASVAVNLATEAATVSGGGSLSSSSLAQAIDAAGYAVPQEVVEMQYRAGIAWVKFIGTHAQYDKIDVEAVNDY